VSDHTCLNPACGASFAGRRRKFCHACLPDHGEVGDKAYMDRYNSLLRAMNGQTTRQCRVCGSFYQTQNTSSRCWNCVKAGKKRCYTCHVIFVAVDRRLKCSKCLTASCIECGCSFQQSKGRKTCSAQCGVALKLRRNQEAGRRRRIRRRGAIKGPYHDLEIFDRDGWRCQICGGLTRPWHRAPHPLAPTIDHIVPLSKGGDDVASNVQCAHSQCNTRKQAGAADDQLRLVG
jgi:HNH endonuclease